MFPPEIVPDECEIMRGGFGGKGWIYTFIVGFGLAPTVLLVPLALWFWLRSSRFVLTDRRLVLKPTIGKVREIGLGQLHGARVTYGSATDSVSLDGPSKLRFRYQRDSEQVWGAFLVMCGWQIPAASPLLGPGCELSTHTMRESDEVSQAGIGVISGDQLAFIPLNSGLRKGGFGKKAALAAAGVRQVTVRAWYPHSALVEVLASRGGDFTGNVAVLARSLGGLVWSLPETQRQMSKRGVVLRIFDERLEMHAEEEYARVIAER